MATSSIFKEVRVKGRTFIKALENAENATTKEVAFSKQVREVKGDDIKKMFR